MKIPGIPEPFGSQILAALEDPTVDRIVLFGSRAKGNYHAGSDIDLALYGPIDSLVLLELYGRVTDLDLPWKVDLVAINLVDHADLLAHIERVGIDLSEQ